MNLSKTLPPKPAYILERMRLIGKLRSWEDKKLIIIHGQAGQGKSTLAAGYVRSLETPSVWYNMDTEDDDPSVFLSCLGLAIQRTYPREVQRLPLIPQNRYGVGGKYQSFTRWIDQVFGSLPEHSLIVFDDYQLTSPYTLLPLLKLLLEQTPPQVRFLLISRVEPAIEIARLRARRAVGEITGEDLRFNDREAMNLFTTVFGMQVPQSQAALINRTAEGWAAGLVLMHEYLLSKNTDEWATAITAQRQPGYQSHVFEYLAQEVFSHLPAEMQLFLLRTSIADYLTTPLIKLLAELPEGPARSGPAIPAMVEELRRRNLFVTVADDEAGVLRYHALFREFLHRKLLAQAKPSEVKKLYTIAANYFKQSGDPIRTVNLYLASGQFEKAVQQIESAGQELISRGQTQTLLRWIENLPLEHGDRPWFSFYRAVACRFTDPRRAFSLFDRALAGFRAERSRERSVPGQMLSLAGLIEACFHAGGNFKRMERAAASASALLSQATKRKSGEARARLLLAMGTAYFFIGRLSQGAEALRQALELFRKIENHFYQIHSAIYLAPCALYLGDMRLAREAVSKGFEAFRSIPDETGAQAALFMAQAMTALFEGNFDEAQECIDTCHGLAREYELEAIDFLALDIGGWLKTAQGDYAGAEQLLRECKEKGSEYQNAFFNSSATHLLAVNFLHQNKLKPALAEAESALTVRSQMGSRLFYATSLSTIAAVNAKLGRAARAEKEYLQSLKIFRQIHAAQQQANVLLLLAKLHGGRKKRESALRFLREGFRIGEERGFTYYYLLNAAEVAELAKTACASGICTEYCALLLRKYAPQGATPGLRVHFLGGFRIYRNSTPIKDSAWKSKKSRTIFKMLAAEAGKKVARDVIIEALWPGEQTESVKNTFKGMLHRVRKLIEYGDGNSAGESCRYIIQEGNLLGLNADAVWTDVGQFLAHLEAAARLKASKNPKKATEEYEKAFALYQGDFLPEDLYEDWTGPARDRLRQSYLKAIEDAAGAWESLDDRTKAYELYEKLFTVDPCSEKACRWLMAWHVAAGQRSEALRVYERCQRALSLELDVEPDVQTRSLYKGMLV